MPFDGRDIFPMFSNCFWRRSFDTFWCNDEHHFWISVSRAFDVLSSCPTETTAFHTITLSNDDRRRRLSVVGFAVGCALHLSVQSNELMWTMTTSRRCNFAIRSLSSTEASKCEYVFLSMKETKMEWKSETKKKKHAMRVNYEAGN